VRGTRRSPHGRPPFLEKGVRSLRLVEGIYAPVPPGAGEARKSLPREGNSQIPSRATPLFRKGGSKSATCRRDLRVRRVNPFENSQIFEDGPPPPKEEGGRPRSLRLVRNASPICSWTNLVAPLTGRRILVITTIPS